MMSLFISLSKTKALNLVKFTATACLAARVSWITQFSSRKFSDDVLFLRAREYKEKPAVIDRNGTFSYNNLLQFSNEVGQNILELCTPLEKTNDLGGQRVAFLCSQDVQYVAVQWAIWRNGGIAVPLSPAHPIDMLDYFIKNSSASLLVTTEEHRSKVQPIAEKNGIPHLDIARKKLLGKTSMVMGDPPVKTEVEEKEASWDGRNAMLIYTSGTTGRPKGVLTTHGNLRAQITSLVQAWGWTESDCILHVLPLHHVHGVVNVLACPLWVGATCVMMPSFDAKQVWDFLTGAKPQLSLFMAVPTIYNKLIQHHRNANYSCQQKEETIRKCSNLRLMVSGSSALPEMDMKNWEEVTGHVLLERYGMTEIGMALSNPLNGSRIPGSVGVPLPGVEVRIVSPDNQHQVLVEGDENGSSILLDSDTAEGMLLVRGPAVFKEYWMRPDATKESFTEDGWFITGDTVRFSKGVYYIVGRPWDIIKSGGYKISALEVERELRQHPYIRDCAVLGVPDPEWGEKIAAIVSLYEGKDLTVKEVHDWGTQHMVRYHIPRVLEVVEELPRNIMGKVNKKEVFNTFFSESP